MQILTSLQEKKFQGMTSSSAADGDLESGNRRLKEIQKRIE